MKLAIRYSLHNYSEVSKLITDLSIRPFRGGFTLPNGKVCNVGDWIVIGTLNNTIIMTDDEFNETDWGESINIISPEEH